MKYWNTLAEKVLTGHFSYVSVSLCVIAAIAVSGWRDEVYIETDTEVR